MLGILKRSFKDWLDDDCPRMAAALSYYTIFSLPPLLLIVLMLAGVFIDPSQLEGRIQSEMRSLLGEEGARQIQTMIQNAGRPDTARPMVAVLSVLGLAFGATSAFSQLQKTLNKAWEVEPDPEKGGFRKMLRKRILSLGMVLTIGFLLLVSLLLSAAVSAFGDTLVGWLPGGISAALLQGMEGGVSLAVITVLFAMIFMILPDAEVDWGDVWVGALATALLFVAGKLLLGFYFARSNPGEAFGAAGSLAIILVWVYYSGLILFFGAEFTQAWAAERGSGIRPAKGAVRVVEEKRKIGGREGIESESAGEHRE